MWSVIVTSPYLKPSRDLAEQVRRLRHRLLAARDDDLELARADQLVGQRDGVDAGQAHLVDRERGHVHRDAARDRGLPRGDLPGARREHLTHDHVLHLLGRDPGPLQRGLDRHATELGAGEALQRAQQPPHGRAGSGDDHGRRHMSSNGCDGGDTRDDTRR